MNALHDKMKTDSDTAKRERNHNIRIRQLESCETLAEFKGIAYYYESIVGTLEKQYDKLEEVNIESVGK